MNRQTCISTNKLALLEPLPHKLHPVCIRDATRHKIIGRDMLSFIAGLVLLFLGAGTQAVTMSFTDSSAFQSALTGQSSVVNFDNVAAGAKVSDGATFQGITFTSNVDNVIGRPGLIVSDNFLTTSPLNFLGVDDGFSNEFLLGDELTLSFSGLVQAIGLFVIGAPGIVLANDFLLTAGGGTVFNGASENTLFDGGEVFFLGLIDDQGFSAAQLISFGDQLDATLGFTIDDITTAFVSEPPIFYLLGLGLLMLNGMKRYARVGSKPIL